MSAARNLSKILKKLLTVQEGAEIKEHKASLFKCFLFSCGLGVQFSSQLKSSQVLGLRLGLDVGQLHASEVSAEGGLEHRS